VVPLPPVRLASLGAAEPAGNLGQARSKAPETKAALADKNATRIEAPALRVTSPAVRQLEPRPQQPPLASMVKAEPVKPAEPPTGTVPKAQQAGRTAAEQNRPSGPVKAPQLASATPSQASTESRSRSTTREGTTPASLRSLQNLPASPAGTAERTTAPDPRSPNRIPAPLLPGFIGRTQTAALAQPQAAAEAEAARKRFKARLQAQERRLRMTLKSICTGC
jgi:hypothetical protein